MTKLLKNLIQGAETIFSINPSPHRPHKKRLYKPHKTAAAAMRSDWRKIAGDFDKVLRRAEYVEK